MLFPLILILARKKNVKFFDSNLECLINTNKNYMVPSMIAQNKKSQSKDLSRISL